jgi:hypothetical protein
MADDLKCAACGTTVALRTDTVHGYAQVGACTKNMNTFGFVGDLNGSPEVSCVYHSEDGENQFLRDPKRSVMGDGFQPHELLDTKKTQAPAQN